MDRVSLHTKGGKVIPQTDNKGGHDQNENAGHDELDGVSAGSLPLVEYQSPYIAENDNERHMDGPA